MPVVHWEGNTFSINGEISFNSTPWIYHQTLEVSGTLSTLGDTLLTGKVYFRQWGNDPYYREWYHWVEVANVPLSSFTITGNNNQFNFEVEGSSVQNYLTKFEDYYYETAQNGSCYYERHCDYRRLEQHESCAEALHRFWHARITGAWQRSRRETLRSFACLKSGTLGSLDRLLST